MPNIIRYASKKVEDKFGQQFGGFQQGTTEPQEEGKTTVYKKPNPKSNPSKKVGEYIEFEEIE